MGGTDNEEKVSPADPLEEHEEESQEETERLRTEEETRRRDAEDRERAAWERVVEVETQKLDVEHRACAPGRLG